MKIESICLNNRVFKILPFQARNSSTNKKYDIIVGHRLPKDRPPTHPGVMLLEEFLVPMGVSQSELAGRLAVSYSRFNGIINGKRSVTPDTALRLAKVLGMSADFWLGMQMDWDLWHAMRSKRAKEIERLRPYK